MGPIMSLGHEADVVIRIRTGQAPGAAAAFVGVAQGDAALFGYCVEAGSDEIGGKHGGTM